MVRVLNSGGEPRYAESGGSKVVAKPDLSAVEAELTRT
jgi:hypothetical protein